jgi:hypothetical protein
VLDFLIWADKRLNSLTGGDPTMTISARVGVAKERCKACWIARAVAGLIDCFAPNHCHESAREYFSHGVQDANHPSTFVR